MNPTKKSANYSRRHRGVAQPGRASALGAECRRFESCRPDQKQNLPAGRVLFLDWEAGFEPAKQVQPKRQRRQRRRRPVGRAKRVNPVAPIEKKPGSNLRNRFSRSVSAGNAGTAPAAPDKPPKIHLSPHNSQRLWGVFSAKARVLFFPRQLPPAPELTKSQDFL